MSGITRWEVPVRFIGELSPSFYEALRRYDINWRKRAVEALYTPLFTREARTMNEQEYEKSIAEPTSIYTKAPMDERKEIAQLRAEREFSRGVWRAFCALRSKVAQIHSLAKDGDFLDSRVVPVPDAPKPDPRKSSEFLHLRDLICQGITKDVADEMIREVRARTVK